MQNFPDHWTCSAIVERKHLIDPSPVYQRGPVWTQGQQQRLIDSMLRGYDIPKLYLTRTGDIEPYTHDVTDGQQRILAIWSFFADKYPLGKDSADIPGFGDLSGLHFSELPAGPKDRIKLFKLTICEIVTATQSEVQELFLRLQDGSSLNPAEKRNAIISGMRDFIADLANNHPVFPLTKISSNRFGWDNLAATVARLETSEGPADVKAPDLKEMYESLATFSETDPAAVRMCQVLDFMARVLHREPSTMNIKWGFVDLYLLISNLMHRSSVDISGMEEDFLLMYESFEKDRRAVEEPADLIADDAPPESRQLFKYIESFVRDGGTKTNIQRRSEVYLARMARQLPRVDEA